MQYPLSVLILVLVLAQSTSAMFIVLVVRVTSLTAHIVPVSNVVTMRMLVWDVKAGCVTWLDLTAITCKCYNLYFCSQFQRQLHIWWCSSCWRLQSIWGESGSMHQWPVGDSVWWPVGQHWCYCGLQTAGIWKYGYRHAGSNVDLYILYCRLFLLRVHLLPPSAGGRAYSNAHFGAGSGPIFLDDVQCTSSDSKLLECSSSPVLMHNCLHSADAGVRCEGEFW